MKSKLYKYLRFRYILLLAILLLILWNNRPVIPIARPAYQSIATVEGDRMTDPADGQTYKVVKLADGKLWMAENLRYKPWAGGSWDLSQVRFPDSIAKTSVQYGRLYTWEVAKKACPKGWHLPTEAEWTAMLNHYGGIGKEAYEALIVGGYTNFDATLSGYTSELSYGASYLHRRGYYWTSSSYVYEDDNIISPYALQFYGTFRRQIYPTSASENSRLSVRCIQD